MKFKVKILGALLLGCPLVSATPQLIPQEHWLVEDLSGLVNRQVIQLNLSTFPLSKSEVKKALNAAQPQTQSDYLVIQRIRAELQEKRDGFTLEAQGQSKLNAFQMNGEDHFSHLNAYDRYRTTFKQLFRSGALDIYLQGNLYSGETAYRHKQRDLAGSYLAVTAENQWLSVGMQHRVWGNAHTSSLILGDMARPFPAVGLQRDKQDPAKSSWFSWLGRWQYQLFVGKPLWREGTRAYQDGKIYGARLSAQPWAYLDVGVSHLSQSLKPQQAETQPVQRRQHTTGIDARMRLLPWLKMPLSVYGQVARTEADQQAAYTTYLFGVDGSHNISHRQTLNWFIEGIESHDSNLPYHTYIDDTYQKLPISYHWGGDMRALAIGTNSAYRNSDVTALVKNHHWQTKLLLAESGAEKRHYVGAEIGWMGDIPMDKYISLKLDTSLWWLKERKTEKKKSDFGVSSKAKVEF